MTGPQLKQLYKSIGWTGRQTAEALEIDPVTLSAIVGRDKVDKRTELAMRFLWQIEADKLKSKGMPTYPIGLIYDAEGRN